MVETIQECQRMCHDDDECHGLWFRERNGLCRTFGSCEPGNRVEHDRSGDLYTCHYDYGHECHCAHGAPVTGSACTSKNGHKCQACDPGYRLNMDTMMCDPRPL
eukprot:UN20612